MKSRSFFDKRILILMSIIPIACLFAIGVGLLVTWVVFPNVVPGNQISDLAPDEIEEFVRLVAAEYAVDDDLEKARQRLQELDIPRPEQYVAFLADRYIQEGRAKDDTDLLNVINLARALGTSTKSMLAYIYTPTPLPTATPLPTNTPEPTHTPTNMPVPTETPIPENTATPVPTDTPTPVPQPTQRPQLAATNTPIPPTNTPAPALDFRVAKVNMLTKQENGGCLGAHQIYVDVLDVQGNPLIGAKIADPPFNNFVRISGEKNEPIFHYGNKLAEIDLYKGAARLAIIEYPEGKPVTSELSPKLSTNDWEIPISWLIQAGYCANEGECRAKWNSGVPGVGSNSLCWGHYSFYLAFQATRPF